ncbi:MAG: SpoIID/LytB domain-containing protein [Candidatus Longimicrobiales bacterium M2_2A_002]
MIRLESEGLLRLSDEQGRVLDQGTGPWVVEGSAGGLTTRNAKGDTIAAGVVLVRPDRGAVEIDGTRYRGAVLLRGTDRGVTAVNRVDLETYLRGVVPLELGRGRARSDMEALKAQAVAARTYAVRHLGRRRHLGFDLFGSVLDQAYGGMGVEDALATEAVEATRGEVLMYGGEVIEAYYHASCGGRTAAVEEVWNAAPRPYLRSVPEAKRGGGWYCEGSGGLRWTETWDEPALLETLRGTLFDGDRRRELTRVDSVAVTRRSFPGRVAELTFWTNLGEERVRGDSIRWVLRPEPDRILGSTDFELETGRDGRVTELIASGTGRGHGVGLCQAGALGRARSGQSYREILSAYYPGTRLVRFYR